MAKGSIRWMGHASCEFTTSDGKVVLFDPWTKDDGNPGSDIGLDGIEKADLVLVSHDHFDHAGSAAAICKKTGALLGGPVQTVRRLAEEGFPAEQVVNFGSGYMPGGGVDLDWITVRAMSASHASDTAVALGHIVIASDGTTVYHAGDTGLLCEMGLYAELYPMDAAFIPIGGVFTMDAKQASRALTLIKPKIAVPIHYKSFPIIAQSADEFVRLAKEEAPDVRVVPLETGEILEL